jgi:magnesium-transporting ATPase (P-type)
MAITTLIAKIIQTLLVMNDWRMIDLEVSCQEKEIVGCQVKNLTMLEDFAQINYLFCDKTGTLTKNQLVFKFIAVGGHCIERDSGDSDFKEFTERVKNHSQIDDQFVDFWRCLCICHDVVQMKFEGKDEVSYTGSSQDEITFLNMCRDVGFVHFVERESNKIRISVRGEIESYTVLKIVEFTSERKRMSVIVRRESDSKVINFIKGADVSIIPRVHHGQSKPNGRPDKFSHAKTNLRKSEKIMNEKSSEGLRTLMFAMKNLEDGLTRETLDKRYKDESFEEDIDLLGVTGLEDLLQDNVRQSVE